MTLAVHRVLKALLWSSIFAMAVFVIAISALFAPIWVTPIAKLWYQSGFEDAVAQALTEIPDSENACIYDDTQNIFVTSIDQLDVERMIEKAVQDKTPRIRLNGIFRDPHFRVYSDGRTYYWSFKDEKFHAFEWNRHLWTLAWVGRRMCDAYKQAPERYRQAFRDRSGIVVTEENFCCRTEPGF